MYVIERTNLGKALREGWDKARSMRKEKDLE